MSVTLPVLHHVGIVVDRARAAAAYENRWGVSAAQVYRIELYLEQLRHGEDEVNALFDAAMPDYGRLVYVENLADGPVIELIEIAR